MSISVSSSIDVSAIVEAANEGKSIPPRTALFLCGVIQGLQDAIQGWRDAVEAANARAAEMEEENSRLREELLRQHRLFLDAAGGVRENSRLREALDQAQKGVDL